MERQNEQLEEISSKLSEMNRKFDDLVKKLETARVNLINESYGIAPAIGSTGEIGHQPSDK